MKKIIIILILLIPVLSNAGFKDDIDKDIQIAMNKTKMMIKYQDRLLTRQVAELVESCDPDELKDMLLYSQDMVNRIRGYIGQYGAGEITYEELKFLLDGIQSLLEMHYLMIKVKQRINK